MKLAKMAIVYVIGLVEDEKTFFMKSKLWNQLVGHLNIPTCMFVKRHFH
jgi:hypothetical protein